MLPSLLANLLSLRPNGARGNFSHVLQASHDSIDHRLASKEPFMHMEEPVIYFTKEDDELLFELYKFTLVDKFLHHKPPFCV